MPDQFETFRDWLEDAKQRGVDLALQPYQQTFLDRLAGMPVHVVEDPIDPRVGYILDKRALQLDWRRSGFPLILDEGPTFTPRRPMLADWEREYFGSFYPFD